MIEKMIAGHGPLGMFQPFTQDWLLIGAVLVILAVFSIPFISLFRELRRKRIQSDAIIRRLEADRKLWRPRAAIVVLALLFGGTAHAQLVQSTLPDSGAAVLQTPYSQQTSVLIAGRFTSPSQTVSDLVAFDAAGNMNCYSNQGNGIFRPVLTSTGIPVPLTAGSALNFGVNGDPQTDRFFTGDLNKLFEVSMTNCAALPTVPPLGYLNVLSIAKVSSGNWTCVSETPGPSACPGGLGTNVIALPSNLLGPLFSELVFIQQPFAQTGGPGAGQPVTFSSNTNQVPLSGDIYLGTFFINSGVVAVSSTDNELFLDSITFNQTLISTPLQSFSVASTQVIGAVVGNFLGNTYDLAVANGNEVDLFAYRGSSWAFNSATQVGAISAITHGNIVSPSEDDVVVQVGSNAIVLGSTAVGEQAATPIISPAAGTYNSAQAVTISDSSAGSVIYYTTDGLTPTTASAIYNGAINVSASETISAFASGSNFLPSSVASAVYVIDVNAPPPPPPPPPVPTPTPTISVTPISQTCVAGCTATYLVSVSNFGNTAPTTSAQATIPKGSCSAAGHVVTCFTTAPTTSTVPVISYRVPLALVLTIVAWFVLPKRRRLAWAFGAIALAGCANGGSKAPVKTTIPGTPAGSYQIAIAASNGVQNAQTTAMLGIQ